jgi:hypothetical protein
LPNKLLQLMLLQFFSAKNVGSETGKLLLKLQFQNASLNFNDIKKVHLGSVKCDRACYNHSIEM